MTKVKQPSIIDADDKLIRFTQDLVSFFDSGVIVKISTKHSSSDSNDNKITLYLYGLQNQKIILKNIVHLEKIINWWFFNNHLSPKVKTKISLKIID